MTAQKILFIGLVWPEPTSSAAGTRIIQLVRLFLAKGDEVHFASAAAAGEFSFNLASIGVKTHAITLNDSAFDTWISELQPNIVVFDRFMIEEQYGWRVNQECPNALRILDTEDLHFLRQARQIAVKGERVLNEDDLYNDITKREIAAILRCDLSLIISEEEMKILQTQFKIDGAVLHNLPFLEEEITPSDIEAWIPFNERGDFVFIGNFLHAPNWHTVQFLKTKIWPLLRKRLPQAKLHIYGAYLSQKVLQLHNPKENFIIAGRAVDARATIAKHKVLLAPIQFGAGVKGKFIDAMHVGTPTVTTTIGAEAMKGELTWNGAITDDVEDFINQAAILYQNETLWRIAQQNGVKIINQRYAKHAFEATFLSTLENLNANLKKHRRQNFLGEILNHNTLQSTKYMSLWIEEKNREDIDKKLANK